MGSGASPRGGGCGPPAEMSRPAEALCDPQPRRSLLATPPPFTPKHPRRSSGLVALLWQGLVTGWPRSRAPPGPHSPAPQRWAAEGVAWLPPWRLLGERQRQCPLDRHCGAGRPCQDGLRGECACDFHICGDAPTGCRPVTSISASVFTSRVCSPPCFSYEDICHWT